MDIITEYSSNDAVHIDGTEYQVHSYINLKTCRITFITQLNGKLFKTSTNFDSISELVNAVKTVHYSGLVKGGPNKPPTTRYGLLEEIKKALSKQLYAMSA